PLPKPGKGELGVFLVMGRADVVRLRRHALKPVPQVCRGQRRVETLLQLQLRPSTLSHEAVQASLRPRRHQLACSGATYQCDQPQEYL
ncbi:MAG: hypothetical protein ABI162_17445, partial [Luteolibacter sp.]